MLYPSFAKLNFNRLKPGRNFILTTFRKLRDEYDKLEGALKKLGVDPECVVTEEEDGYNAESDLEDDTEQDCEREVETFVPAVYSVGGGGAALRSQQLARAPAPTQPVAVSASFTSVVAAIFLSSQKNNGKYTHYIKYQGFNFDPDEKVFPC